MRVAYVSTVVECRTDDRQNIYPSPSSVTTTNFAIMRIAMNEQITNNLYR